MKERIGWIFFPVFLFVIGCSTPMVEGPKPRQVYFDSGENKVQEEKAVTVWLRAPPVTVYLNGVAVAQSPPREVNIPFAASKPLKIKIPKGRHELRLDSFVGFESMENPYELDVSGGKSEYFLIAMPRKEVRTSDALINWSVTAGMALLGQGQASDLGKYHLEIFEVTQQSFYSIRELIACSSETCTTVDRKKERSQFLSKALSPSRAIIVYVPASEFAYSGTAPQLAIEWNANYAGVLKTHGEAMERQLAVGENIIQTYTCTISDCAEENPSFVNYRFDQEEMTESDRYFIVTGELIFETFKKDYLYLMGLE